MIELITILRDIILPVFIIIITGFFIQRKNKLDIQTLARINIYFLVPGFIFVNLYTTTVSANLFVYILVFFIIYILSLYLIAAIASKSLKLNKKKKATFSNSIMFYNSGNYGIPVNDLVFKSDPLAMSVQVIILTLQNMFVFSYGIFSFQSIDTGKMKAMLGYFKMPVLYAMLAGIVFNYYNVSISSYFLTSANYIADAMIALSLFTLGAQVAQLRFDSGIFIVYLNLSIRLIVGPLLAFLILFSFGITGIIAKALFISSAMPTSVNSSVIAQEYNNYPSLAAQTVLFSTIFSSITVTIVIYLSKFLF